VSRSRRTAGGVSGSDSFDQVAPLAAGRWCPIPICFVLGGCSAVARRGGMVWWPLAARLCSCHGGRSRSSVWQQSTPHIKTRNVDVGCICV